jgi:hypothetical protein
MPGTEGSDAEMNLVRIRQVNQERLFALLGVTGECPVGEPAAVTSFLGVDDSARDRETQRSEAGTKYQGAYSTAADRARRAARQLRSVRPIPGRVRGFAEKRKHDHANHWHRLPM